MESRWIRVAMLADRPRENHTCLKGGKPGRKLVPASASRTGRRETVVKAVRQG